MKVSCLFLSAITLACLLTPPAGAQQCQLCAPTDQSAPDNAGEDIPLNITITTSLNFSRAALTGHGSSGHIAVDPQSGSSMQGGVVALGGYAVAGKVELTGAPGRNIRIDLPGSIRMTSAGGGIIDVSNIRTNLSASPRLDPNGKLSFSFGGELNISGKLSGKFRGRIPITAQYE